MQVFISGRRGGKTTELYEWLARGSLIEAEYLSHHEPMWNRAIVTISEERARSTRRYLQRWLYMHDAYRGLARERVTLVLNPIIDAVYTRDEIHSAHGKLWNPLREGHLKLAVDDAEHMLEYFLGAEIAVATFTAEPYVREQRAIEKPIRRIEPKSNVNEMLHPLRHKGDLSL